MRQTLLQDLPDMGEDWSRGEDDDTSRGITVVGRAGGEGR